MGGSTQRSIVIIAAIITQVQYDNGENVVLV